MLAYIHPIEGIDGHPSNELPGIPGRPSNPIVIPPPLPGVWPPPGIPSQPIQLPPPGEASNPIVIPGSPEHPIALPPGIWPPLPPSSTGKYAVLVLVLGVGYRWVVVDAPAAQPK